MAVLIEAERPGRQAALAHAPRPTARIACALCLAAGLLCSVLTGCTAAGGAVVSGSSGARHGDAERRIQYFYYLTELAPCIRTLRFPVGPPPDLEEFLSQKPELAWTPWIDLQSSASSFEVASLHRICPPDPTAER